MLDAGFLHFHHFIFQGWYLNSPSHFIFPMCAKSLSHVQLFGTLWTVDLQAPLSMGSSRQKCWCGLPFPSPGDLPDPGIEPASAASPALSSGFFTTVPPGKPLSFLVFLNGIFYIWIGQKVLLNKWISINQCYLTNKFTCSVSLLLEFLRKCWEP